MKVCRKFHTTRSNARVSSKKQTLSKMKEKKNLNNAYQQDGMQHVLGVHSGPEPSMTVKQSEVGERNNRVLKVKAYICIQK